MLPRVASVGSIKPGNGAGFAPGRTRARNRVDDRLLGDATWDMRNSAAPPLLLKTSGRSHDRHSGLPPYDFANAVNRDSDRFVAAVE